MSAASGVALIQSIIQMLVGGLVPMAVGMGVGLKDMFLVLFTNATITTTEGVTSITAGTDPSVVLAVVAAFGSIALATGLFRWVLNLITSLGARNR